MVMAVIMGTCMIAPRNEPVAESGHLIEQLRVALAERWEVEVLVQQAIAVV